MIAGKPDESHLVLRIKGDEEPRMPQGGNNRMSDEAIAKIEQWVKEGAKLDAGLDPKKPIKSYAASPEQVLRNQIAKLPPAERDKKVEAVGRERWKQANPKLKPEIVSGEHFLMFSNLPSDRATSTIKVMETQYGHLKRLLGSPSTDWVEKVSLYVFSSRNDFIEFVRTVESREVDADAHASAKLSIPQPYLAVVDPAGGKKEEPAAGKRRRRGRDERGDRGGGGAVGSQSGRYSHRGVGHGHPGILRQPPRWLAEGFGSYMAAQVEPRSPYYRQLRQTAFANFDQGWKTKANEASGRKRSDHRRRRSCHRLRPGGSDDVRDASGLPGFRQRHDPGRGEARRGAPVGLWRQPRRVPRRNRRLGGVSLWTAAMNAEEKAEQHKPSGSADS